MKPQRIEITRRSFIAALGGTIGGLALGLRLFDEALAEALPAGGFSPNLFVHIAPDGLVSIVCHRSEMGQGIRSSLPVLVADELGADWARVRVVQADGDARYGNQNTDGSRSVRDFYDAMRVVGATARAMLVTAAARRWNVPEAGLTAHGHAVHDGQGRSLGFGELVEAAAALPVPAPETVTLRPESELRRVGNPLPLIDGPEYVNGKAAFGADVRLPGMLTAVIVRPPVVGGKVARVNDAAALKVPGVRRIVTLPTFTAPARFQPLGGVAVVAEHTWAALRGRAALEVEWELGDNATYDSTAYKAALEASVRAPGQAVRTVGDADRELSGAGRVVAAEYHVPHLAHAPMEPPVAVARVDGNGCEVWAPTQNPQAAQAEVARALGIEPAKVTVHVTFLGGGFGRKSKADYVSEAALLAREVGAPVRVQWTRADDVRHGYYHSVSTQRLEAALDSSGKVTAWRHRIASPSISSIFSPQPVERISPGELGQGVLDLPLAIPNVRVESCKAPAHVRIGWLRSVFNINHAFAVQSFIDEIAAAAGRDPREVLLEILGPARILTPAEIGVENVPNYGAKLEEHPIDAGRLRNVIERVTERAGWEALRKAGRAVGLAAHRSFLTYVAAVVAVSRGPRGIQVDEVWITADAGKVINPDRVHAQLEGAVIFGLSAALHGAITMRGGAVEQSNFRDYPLARIGEAPRKIHTEILPSPHPPGGVGEPGVPPIAPAIANAVFALTGKRVRELPLRRAQV